VVIQENRTQIALTEAKKKCTHICGRLLILGRVVDMFQVYQYNVPYRQQLFILHFDL
jgi:uncharacterized membrane protein YecN with MAPEG domain